MKIEYHDGEVVEMLFDSKLHSYKVGKEVVPNATKILDIISKPALVPWALKVGGDWLEKNFFFDQEASSKKTNIYKSRMALEPLIKGMKGAYRGVSRDALNIGSLTHEWVEAAINWKISEGEIPQMPKQEEAVNAIHAFQDWVGENVVEWKSSEEKIYHRKYKYAGTVDARAIINGEYCVIDWKTSKRIYPEYYLQVAAYAKAIEDMHGIPVDATYILRCDKATGKFEAVRSTEIEENFQAFLAAKTLKAEVEKYKMSIPAMIVFHFDSALELTQDGMDHELFDVEEMESLLEGCAQQSEYAGHEYMWRALKRMLRQHDGENVVGFTPESRGPDVKH